MLKPRELPVWQSREQILHALAENQVIIVESPTGSGKTTQIPLILKDAGYTEMGLIGITQPRRIATQSVCSFISNQISDENLPLNFCAYKMRFYDTTDENTRIKILTDGMLLQEIKADPLLSKYSVIMVDEAHERSLNIDFILGILKQLIPKRPELRVIISSATLNTKVFSKFFTLKGKPAPIISIKTRQYDVEIKYYPLKNNDTEELEHSICQIINVLLKQFKKSDYQNPQDTLVFLPGEQEIKNTLQNLYQFCDFPHLQVYPLYGRLNKEEQEQVFEKTKPGKMKIVLATNIAETSLTIDNIKVVIDSGLAKMNFYNQHNFTSALISRPVSKSSALQRSGRAGRTSNGICYRLYSKEDFDGRSLFTREEILRTDLTEVVLRMVDLGIKNFEDFPFITRPEKNALISAERTLITINAIDNGRNLTSIGRLMTAYPLLPRHSRCIVQAILNYPDIVKPVAICVSFLSCKTPFILPQGEEDQARLTHRRFSSEFGDFIGYQHLYRKYAELNTDDKKTEFCSYNYLDKQCMDEIVHVVNQLCDITREIGIPVNENVVLPAGELAHKCIICLCTGLIQYVCVNKKKSVYSTATADEIYIHPGSAYFRNPPKYLLAGEIVQTSKLYARTVSPVDSSWLNEVLPQLIGSLKKVSSRNKEQTEKRDSSVREIKTSEKTINIYGFCLNLKNYSDKKSKPVAIIPYEQLPKLAKAYRNASRHPKNINASILFNGYNIHYGDRLYDIIRLCGKIDFNQSNLIKLDEKTVFFEDNIENLIPFLKNLMKLSPLPKYKDRLGFVELIGTGKGVMLHVNASFTEALNNTAYCLLSIMDINDRKEFSGAYNRIVRLLD